MMSDYRFLRAYRITRGADFQRAYQRRLTAGDNRLLVFAYPNGLPHPRLGLSVSRKVGGAVGATAGNAVSARRFASREQLPAGVDLIVIPRPDVVPATKELQESLVKLACRAAKRI